MKVKIDSENPIRGDLKPITDVIIAIRNTIGTGYKGITYNNVAVRINKRIERNTFCRFLRYWISRSIALSIEGEGLIPTLSITELLMRDGKVVSTCFLL